MGDSISYLDNLLVREITLLNNRGEVSIVQKNCHCPMVDNRPFYSRLYICNPKGSGAAWHR